MAGQVINPYDREKMAKAREMQEKVFKLVTSKRTIKITFVDNSVLEINDNVAVTSDGSFYTIYHEEKGEITKFHVNTIKKVEEKLVRQE